MGQVRFENFDFLVKVKVHLVKAFFSLTSFFFFFFEAVRTGSGCGSVRVKPGQNLVGGDVMDDVTALDACGTCGTCVLWAPTVWRVCAREL